MKSISLKQYQEEGFQKQYTKPFRPIPLCYITLGQQVEQLKEDIEQTRMKHAFKMGKQIIKDIREGHRCASPQEIITYLETECVFDRYIPTITEMVLEALE